MSVVVWNCPICGKQIVSTSSYATSNDPTTSLLLYCCKKCRESLVELIRKRRGVEE